MRSGEERRKKDKYEGGKCPGKVSQSCTYSVVQGGSFCGPVLLQDLGQSTWQPQGCLGALPCLHKHTHRNMGGREEEKVRGRGREGEGGLEKKRKRDMRREKGTKGV